MALSSTSFVNGQIGNPNGRPLGSRNKRTKEVIQQIIESNNKDPLITLSEISSNDPDSAIRATAANMLAPYMHSKMQSTPAPRFVEELVVVPDFTTIESAEDYLKTIPVLLGRGEIDSQTALELSTLVRNWILSVHARSELELKKINVDGPGEQRIVIQGGLPVMPGLEGVVMPQLNGHATNGHHAALAAPVDAVPAIEAAHKAQDPEPPPQDPEL
jgi:hypothetical protein